VDRRFLEPIASKFSTASTEKPIEYKEPAKGAVPMATQRRSIYFEPNSSNIGLDSRAVVDEIGSFMKAYENTVVDIDGNTDATGSRPRNLELSKARAEAVKNYLVTRHGIDPSRITTEGRGSQDSTGNAEQDRRAVVILSVQ
jgi:outer membrane protein OmpA-like peptidoglycan-associated protein